MQIAPEFTDLLIETPTLTLLVFDEPLLAAYKRRKPITIWSSQDPVTLTWPVSLREIDEVKPFIIQTMQKEPESVGWLLWAIAQPGDDAAERGALEGVGLVGFQGPPDRTGSVDIGYAVHPNYQNRGIATKAVGLLTDWAFSQGVARVTAEVYPFRAASRRVLEKNAFKLVGQGANLGTMRLAKSVPGSRS